MRDIPQYSIFDFGYFSHGAKKQNLLLKQTKNKKQKAGTNSIVEFQKHRMFELRSANLYYAFQIERSNRVEW